MPKTSVQARAQNGKDGVNAFYDQPVMGAINPLTFFTIHMAGAADSGIPAWSYYPQIRDYYLRILARNEPIMASAVYNVTSRVKSLPWEIEKGGRRDKKYYQELYAEADGGDGYGQFISKVVTDLLTQDNGAFIELVGAGREDRPLVGRVREIWYMDSAQCLGRDTRVLMADGTTKTIFDIVRNRIDAEVLAYDANGHLVPRRIVGWHETELGDRQWMRLTLQGAGRTFGRKQGLWLTNDHPVLTQRGWVDADHLTVQDRVITSYPSPNDRQAQLMSGTMLGDGMIRPGKTQDAKVFSFTFCHGVDQREWLELKQSSMLGWNSSPIYQNRNLLTYTSHATPALAEWRKQWYPNGGKKAVARQIVKDNFSPLMLAVWYLDDGNIVFPDRKSPAAKLTTNGFSRDDIEWLSELLRENGIDNTIQVKRPGQWDIYITARRGNAHRFFEQIAPYVPSSMRYKLPSDMPRFNPELWDLGTAERYADQVESIEFKPNGTSTATYCLDIEVDHNFIAADMVVHNCWRTFDREYPVIYIDPMTNTYHKMHHTRVITLSSFPQGDERARNIGFCAVSRALRLMQTMRNTQIFKDEKITGKFNRGLIYGSGFTVKQFDEAVERSEQMAEAVNFTVYKDIPVLLSMMQDVRMDVLNLASLPDGFDWEQELTMYAYCLAMAFGTDAREFWPATQSGATKADASIQHLKAQGKGIADIIKTLETGFNWKVQPGTGKSPFEYDFTDDEADRTVAELHGIKADNIKKYQDAGWIDAFEGRALAIHEGLIDPRVFVVSSAAEPATDSAPLDDEEMVEEIDRPEAEEADPDAVDAFEFDPATEQGAKAAAVQFDESKHQRASDGKFGSGGGTETDREGNQIGTSPGGMKFKLTPLADRVKAFLGILNQAGSYENGKLLIKKSRYNRSKDLETYLRNKGFPDATVTATKVGKGYEYTINNAGANPSAPAKRKRKPRKKKTVETTETIAALPDTIVKKKELAAGRKNAVLDQYLAEYQAALNDMYDDFINQVAEFPATLDEALDDLYDEFLNNMPMFLTTGFGVGLQGAEPSTPGINRLEKIGQLSADFFADSFMLAFTGLGVGGLDVEGIKAALEALRARFLMYAGAMWEAIWAGLFDATPATRRVRRVMEQGAHHCEVCPDIAKEYESFDAMVAEVGLPGDGSTPCLTNCRCTVEVETEPGSGVFVSITGDPTVFVRPLFEVLKKS